MFNTVSMTGTGVIGVIVYVVILVAQHFGVSIAEAQLTTQIQNVLGFVSFILTVWGQFRRPDLKVGLIRK